MKQETILNVLKTYEIHYPHFFRDKTTEDKMRLATDWFQIYHDVEDDVFIRACADLVKNVDFFPSTKELRTAIEKAKLVMEFELSQEKFRLYNLVDTANWTDEEINTLATIDSFFESPDCLTDKDFLEDKYKAIETLKREYKLSDEQIRVLGTKLKEASKDANTKEHFKNVMYDAVVLKRKAITG